MTRPDIETAYRRLITAWRAKDTEEEIAAGLAEWAKMLTSFTSLEVEDAADRAVRLLGTEGWNKGFPKPGQFLGLVTEERNRRLTEVPAGRDYCHACGVDFYLAGFQTWAKPGEPEPSGPVYPRWRCGCPRMGLGWTTHPALAWVEREVEQHRS